MRHLLWASVITVVVMSIRMPGQENRANDGIRRGKEIFEQCRGCHNTETMEKKVGPSLKGLFKRAKLSNGKAATEKNIRSRIDQGGDGMPSFSDILSDKDKNDLIAYLRTQ